MTLAQDITRAFNGDWRGDQGFIPTPGHSLRDRGSTVRDGDDGDVIFHSFNGGDWRALKDECRRRGLLPERMREEIAQRWRVTGVYEFTDADGTVLYRTRRMEHPAKPKRFEVQRPDGKGGWIDKLGDCPRVLYRLPELLASDPTEPVYFVEGERKADKLAAWGLVATSIAFGAKGWRKSYADALAGRTVIFLPDNDQPGHEFAEKARPDMEAAGAVVRIIDLPGLPPKGDIIDWAGSADDLQALVENAPNPRAKLLPLLDPAVWNGQETPSREWAWNDYIPHRQATYLTGPGSAGKSLLTQQLCTAIALGVPFMGVETRQAVAIYVTCEDDADELHRRQKAICESMGVPLSALSGKLYLVSLAGAPGNELAMFTPEGKMIVGDAYGVLLGTAMAVRAGFLALDNVAHLFAGNENIRNQVAAFVSLLNGLALEIDGSVLFLGHPNKAGQHYSGSTAWENQVRSRLFMEVPKDELGNAIDPDVRTLRRGKANYARNGDRLEFRWHKWAFVREDDLPAGTRAELAEVAKANGENAAFMRCLAAATDSKRAVSHNPGVNYYGSVFPSMAEGKGFGRKAFEAAFERLLHLGEIELDKALWKRENRTWKYGIKAAEKCTDPPAPTPCTDPHQPPAQTLENACTDPHAPTPLYTTYIAGAAHGSAAPSSEMKNGHGLSHPMIAAGIHADLDGTGDTIGWND